MSLTSHLEDRQSPVRKFLCEQLPNTRPIAAEWRATLSGANTLCPLERPSGGTWGTIGMALDYRLRYYFAVTPVHHLAAYVGAMFLATADLPPSLVIEYFTDLDQAILQISPVGRRLNHQEEALLARYCWVLALFEQIARAGPFIRSPLLPPAPKMTVAAMLDIAEDRWIEDLCTLSWAFYDGFSHLLTLPAILNPTFEGSIDVGGADADLILDHCLIEIKTTVRPDLKRAWLYQLLGYALLDYTDRYKIREVAIYLARQQALVRWQLEPLIEALAAESALPLCELRGRFQGIAHEVGKRESPLRRARARRALAVHDRG